MSEKLQKTLARAGYGSRRQIETMIAEGRIAIDGKTAKLGDRISINSHAQIRLDGKMITLQEITQLSCRVLLYYKPEGEISTRKDPEGRTTVFDHLPAIKNSRWINIGRLDINTSGLLLFTNDGELANRLMHPSHEVEREYAVRVFGEVDQQKLNMLKNGIQLEDGLAKFKRVIHKGGEGLNQWYQVVLTEGRNREVRRIWEAVNVQVSRLIRIRYGNIELPKNLHRGGWKELPLSTVNYLKKSVGLQPESEPTNTMIRTAKNRVNKGKTRGTPKNYQRGSRPKKRT